MSYLFISHNMAVIRYMSDELMVLYRGRVVEQGPTEDIVLNPKEEYTKNLLRYSQ